jgi:CHASE3 domain sensor protein
MSSRKKARLAFLSALILLFGCGIAASIAISRFIRAARWAAHSYEVQVGLGDLQTALSNAARTRTVYQNSGDETTLAEYPAMKRRVHNDLDQLRDLVRDNPSQSSLATTSFCAGSSSVTLPSKCAAPVPSTTPRSFV